jgi:hypothetical protein
MFIATAVLFAASAHAAEVFLGTFEGPSPERSGPGVRCYSSTAELIYNDPSISRALLYKISDDIFRIETYEGKRLKHNLIVREIGLCEFNGMTFTSV